MERPPAIREFQKMVLGYYRDHGRDLAWRKTTDPYRILVSEIMLQQTQVERVSVKFPAFIARFPDFRIACRSTLAGCPSGWQGMGYNRRAISLQKCARRVVEEFDGILPQDPEILATFPGIGRATAASICAFAFNMPVVFIETNIRRVFIHYFFGDSESVDDSEILPMGKENIVPEGPADMVQRPHGSWYRSQNERSGTRTAAAGIIQNRQHSRDLTGRSVAVSSGYCLPKNA